MKKMRLNPDQLAVESFPTDTRDPRVPGTVHAREDTSYGCEDDSMARCTEGCDFPPSFFSGDDICCDIRDARHTDAPGCIP
jgi:hypothetical protein